MTSNSRVVVIGAGRRPVGRPGTPATGEAPETPGASVGGEEQRPCGRLPLAGVTARPTLPPRSPFSPLPNDGGS
ncbi:hypothetical protein ACIRBZ_40335 [Streptomyces sp. NPDC094038]|uniref:hypothetical protein n=1 Tax=Streptomyces sp. NPDC094038 TaxID=3366055 RepID=UPI00381D540D